MSAGTEAMLSILAFVGFAGVVILILALALASED